MYRILIADDEGIMLESLKTSIGQSFGGKCEVATAKSGRAVIEQAEMFRPDIIFMDIQMPGINGIQAIREIRKFNTTALFYVISAYDKFDYAKEALNLGVEKYLTKPITKQVFLGVVAEAMEKVDKSRQNRSRELQIQEKLEIIVPFAQSGFVNSVVLQNDAADWNYYRLLLDIKEAYGYVCVFAMGTECENGRLISPVGLNIRAQEFYPDLCAIVRSHFSCIIGPMMSNRLVVVVCHAEPEMSYEERIQVIATVRQAAERMEKKLEARFRVGIGKLKRMDDLHTSYVEAFRALHEHASRVVHAEDLQMEGHYEESFPAETEKKMFEMLRKGNLDGMTLEANRFFDWMVECHGDEKNNIRLKVLEFVTSAERDAFQVGAVNYGFSDRRDYLGTIMDMGEYDAIRSWFLEKMRCVCCRIRDKNVERSESLVEKAKSYIRENYSREISLDDLSKEVNISPYYFSKIFKDESGTNFTEYLTGIRIQKAKELLADEELSIKEVGVMSGYGDPNYFSRIFKKQTGVTPREYRVGLTGKAET